MSTDEASRVQGHIARMTLPEQTNCFHCGMPNWGDSSQHAWCKEGMSIGEYNRAHRKRTFERLQAA
jgi:hypothetical protein